MQIYLARNNQQAGPYTLDQVNAMLANTQVVLTDLAWHEGMSTWLPIGQLTGGKMVYIPSTRATTPTVPVSPTTQASSVRYTEAAINPSKVLAQGATLASIGQRVGAALIDFMILYMITQIVFSMSMTTETVTALHGKAVALLQTMMNGSKDVAALTHEFYALFPASTLQAVLITALIVTGLQIALIATRGQTIGKMILKIKIVDGASGDKATFFRSVLLRSVLIKYVGYYFVSPLVLLADFAFLFTEQKRSLHDRLAKTLVVKVEDSVKQEKPKF